MTTKGTGGGNVEAIYPLSNMQQGLLFQTLYSETWEYFQQVSYTLRGRLDPAALKRAWERVVERHPVLRTLFMWERADKPLQVVRRKVTLPWVTFDWRGVPEPEQQGRLEAFLEADRELGFDLSKAPLMRTALIRLDEEKYQFTWSYHHILMDGWSGTAVRNEVFALYHAFCQGRDLEIPRPRPYRDYIAWLQQQDLRAAEEFWREQLGGFHAPTPVRLGPPPPPAAERRRDYDQWGTQLPPEATAAMQSFVRQHRLTSNTLLKGMWALLLSHYAGERDVLFGSVVSGRPAELEGVETMVGVFINTLPVRVRVEPDEPLLPWLKRMQAQQAEMSQFEYTPLSDIRGWSEVPRPQPLFESILVFQNFPHEAGGDAAAGAAPQGLEVSEPRVVIRNNYPFTLRSGPDPGVLNVLYDCRRFEKASIARVMRQVETLLGRMVSRPEATLAELLAEVLEADRRHLLDKEREFKEAGAQKLKGLRRRGLSR
jgi:hypothetical protein